MHFDGAVLEHLLLGDIFEFFFYKYIVLQHY